jgi:hypothetical protein
LERRLHLLLLDVLSEEEKYLAELGWRVEMKVLFLQRGLWSHIRLTSFPHTCFLTFLVMSFALQLVSDFVFTSHVLMRQRHGIKVTPLQIVVILMISKMSSMSFSTACRKYASLFPPTGAHDVSTL